MAPHSFFSVDVGENLIVRPRRTDHKTRPGSETNNLSCHGSMYAREMSESSDYSFIEWSRGISRTRRGRQRHTFVYFAESAGRIKIGCSGQPWRRAYKLSTGNPNGVQILAAVPGRFADERALHRRFAHLRISCEWFRADAELRVFIHVTASTGRLPPMLGDSALPAQASRIALRGGVEFSLEHAREVARKALARQEAGGGVPDRQIESMEDS